MKNYSGLKGEAGKGGWNEKVKRIISYLKWPLPTPGRPIEFLAELWRSYCNSKTANAASNLVQELVLALSPKAPQGSVLYSFGRFDHD